MGENKRTIKTALNTKQKDATSKIIFQDKELCAEFLNGYVDVPILGEVHPEDIENISERYTPLFASEREADSVLRVHTNAFQEKSVCYVISLIEHKSSVDYNVCMQIFRYMVYIWEDYEREMEKKQKGISKKADFRYPPIIPIVYYEGEKKWNAPTHFRQKIVGGEHLGKYIPDFECFLVPVCGYTRKELLGKKDAISLVMLMQQMQSAEAVHEFLTTSGEEMCQMVENIPDHTMKVVHDILLAMMLYINVPSKEAEDIASKVREKKMGVLFANAEKMDIQLERRRTEEAKEDAEMAIRVLIESIQEYGGDRNHMLNLLKERMHLSEDDAKQKIETYWK